MVQISDERVGKVSTKVNAVMLRTLKAHTDDSKKRLSVSCQTTRFYRDRCIGEVENKEVVKNRNFYSKAIDP